MAKKNYRRYPRGKKRDTLRGGRGGKADGVGRRTESGLFYALRACVKVTLALAGEGKVEDLTPLVAKLKTWEKEADAWWKTDVRVREQESRGRQLPGEVAPGEGPSSAGCVDCDGKGRRVMARPKKPDPKRPPTMDETVRDVYDPLEVE